MNGTNENESYKISHITMCYEKLINKDTKVGILCNNNNDLNETLTLSLYKLIIKMKSELINDKKAVLNELKKSKIQRFLE